MIYAVATLNHAVQEGAHLAVLANTSGETQVAAAINDAATLITVQNVTASVNGGAKAYSNRDLGDRLTVTAETTYVPIFGAAFGGWGIIPLSAQTEIMVE
jgi:hypothetical protein